MMLNGKSKHAYKWKAARICHQKWFRELHLYCWVFLTQPLHKCLLPYAWKAMETTVLDPNLLMNSFYLAVQSEKQWAMYDYQIAWKRWAKPRPRGSVFNCLIWYTRNFPIKSQSQSTIDYKRKTTNEQRARSSKTRASVEEHDNAQSTHTQGAHYCYLCSSSWCFAYVCSSSALLEQLNKIETFHSRSLLSLCCWKVKKLQAFLKYLWLASITSEILLIWDCCSDLPRFH